MNNGIILLDSLEGKKIDFTSEYFEGFSYLWKLDDTVYISFVASKQPGKGHYKNLCNKIHALGLTIKVPTPLGQMVRICKKNGFTKTRENTELGTCEVYVKKPPADLSLQNSPQAH